MRVSELLTSIAEWLENEENEAIMLSEHDEPTLQLTASTLVEAAKILRKGAEAIEITEPAESTELTPERLENIAIVAATLDEHGLTKEASVLDEILLTLAAPKNAIFEHKKAQSKRLDALRKKYQGNKETLDDLNKVSETEKAIKDSPYGKQYRPLEAALSTRYCPDHAGSPISRVDEGTWQCSLDKKIYNFENGYLTIKGNKVPGGSVQGQTPDHADIPEAVFDSRESRLGNS